MNKEQYNKAKDLQELIAKYKDFLRTCASNNGVEISINLETNHSNDIIKYSFGHEFGNLVYDLIEEELVKAQQQFNDL